MIYFNIEETVGYTTGVERAQPRAMPLGFQRAIFMEVVDFIEGTLIFSPLGKGRIESLREETTPALSRSSQFHPLVPHPASATLSRAHGRGGRPSPLGRGGIVGRRNVVSCVRQSDTFSPNA
jgi:hypothetical protein